MGVDFVGFSCSWGVATFFGAAAEWKWGCARNGVPMNTPPHYALALLRANAARRNSECLVEQEWTEGDE